MIPIPIPIPSLGLDALFRRRRAAWTPASPGGLRLWLRFDAINLWADDGRTTRPTTGDEVAWADDLSGNDRHVSFPAGYRPTYQSGGVLRFPAGSDFGSVTWAGDLPLTVAAVGPGGTPIDIAGGLRQDGGTLGADGQTDVREVLVYAGSKPNTQVALIESYLGV